ncbi:hypothetical protein [Microcoleus sp. CZ3-B2]
MVIHPAASKSSIPESTYRSAGGEEVLAASILNAGLCSQKINADLHLTG